MLSKRMDQLEKLVVAQQTLLLQVHRQTTMLHVPGSSTAPFSSAMPGNCHVDVDGEVSNFCSASDMSVTAAVNSKVSHRSCHCVQDPYEQDVCPSAPLAAPNFLGATDIMFTPDAILDSSASVCGPYPSSQVPPNVLDSQPGCIGQPSDVNPKPPMHGCECPVRRVRVSASVFEDGAEEAVPTFSCTKPARAPPSGVTIPAVRNVTVRFTDKCIESVREQSAGDNADNADLHSQALSTLEAVHENALCSPETDLDTGQDMVHETVHEPPSMITGLDVQQQIYFGCNQIDLFDCDLNDLPDPTMSLNELISSGSFNR